MNSDAIFNVKFFSFHLPPSRIGQPPSFSSSDNMGAIPIFWKLQIYEASSLGDSNKINSTTWWIILFRWTWPYLKLRIVHASLISPFGHLIWHRLLLLHRLLQHHFQLEKQKCRWKLFSPGFWHCLPFFQIQCSTDTCGQESCCSWESCHRHISRNHRMVLHWCPCTQTFHLQHWHKSDIKKNLRFCFWVKNDENTLWISLLFCSRWVGVVGWWLRPIMKHNQLLINLFWTSLECFNLFLTPLEHSILPLMVIQSAGSPEGWYSNPLPPSHLLALKNSST